MTLNDAATHEVFNQPPPRDGLNEFTENIPLGEFVTAIGGVHDISPLTTAGAVVGSATFRDDARLANEHPPVLRSHDRYGHRIDEVEYHPAYHRILRQAISAGAHTAAQAHPAPGASALRAAVFMQFAQIEPGHACPVSMTHAAVEPLSLDPRIAEHWLPRVYSRSYEPALLPEKGSALVGMAMTEKQGGSDVRANRTTAVPTADGSYRLTGHKWFCSAPMSDAFFVLAKISTNLVVTGPINVLSGGSMSGNGHSDNTGLSCFLVPRLVDASLPNPGAAKGAPARTGDGMARNPFLIQRLKDKVGNRSNASCEVEFSDTVGFLVGEPGHGVRAIMGMVGRTRLDCVLGSAAGMRQAVAEAVWHARHRAAFGAPLVDQPLMANVLSDLALESEAATALAMRLARSYDDDAEPSERRFRRLATAIGKYWVCKRGPNHAYEAMECLGGNGYTEAFPLGMRYREQPVLSIWEGAGNVIALDVLRAMAVEPESVAALMTELELARGVNVYYDGYLGGIEQQLHGLNVSEIQVSARKLVEMLALTLQASLLIRYSVPAVYDAFVASRLGADRSFEYGTLAQGTDFRGILARA